MIPLLTFLLVFTAVALGPQALLLLLILVLLCLAFSFLVRSHPFAAIFLLGFLRGLTGRRR